MEKKHLQVKASEEVLRGVYANLMQVSHSREEVLLDFLTTFPPQPSLVSRVIVTPAHLKRILRALSSSLKKYEEQYGKITSVDAVEEEREIGFQADKR